MLVSSGHLLLGQSIDIAVHKLMQGRVLTFLMPTALDSFRTYAARLTDLLIDPCIWSKITMNW